MQLVDAGPVPAVSVLMTAYQEERFLGRAVESIRRQTFADLELIIVDDGSSDGSPAQMDGLTDVDDRIRVIRLPRSGRTAALNVGLQAARAELVALMDADDVSHPDRLRRQVEFLDAHPDVTAVSTWLRTIDEDDRPLDASRRVAARPERIAISSRRPSAGPSMMARTAALRSLGYREAFPPAEDYDMQSRLRDAGFVLAVIEEPLYDYRLNAGSASVLQRRAQIAATINAKISHQLRINGEVDAFEGLPRMDPCRIRWDWCPVDARPGLEARWLRGIMETADLARADGRREALDAARDIRSRGQGDRRIRALCMRIARASLLAGDLRGLTRALTYVVRRGRDGRI